MKGLNRRILLIAMAGLPAALAGPRLPPPPPSDIAAALAARIAGIAGPRAGPQLILRAMSPAVLPELLTAILGGRDAGEITVWARLDDRELRQRIEATIRSDFARGATALHGGWLLSHAELAILALLSGGSRAI